MAVSYKGLVIKFGGDTTGLQDALKSVQKQARNAQSNLRDVNRELKFDPSNADLLELKMNALNKSVEETKKQLDMYKQALQQLESKKQSGAKLTAQEEAQYDSLKLAIVRCERQLDSYGTPRVRPKAQRRPLASSVRLSRTTPTAYLAPVPRFRARAPPYPAGLSARQRR